MKPLPTPQVAAVHQTLAGERLTCQVQFPMTGDPDCDFIQGILAVTKAIDIKTRSAVCVLRYLLDRFGRELEPGQDYMSQLIKHQVREQIREAMYQQSQQQDTIGSGNSR